MNKKRVSLMIIFGKWKVPFLRLTLLYLNKKLVYRYLKKPKNVKGMILCQKEMFL